MSSISQVQWQSDPAEGFRQVPHSLELTTCQLVDLAASSSVIPGRRYVLSDNPTAILVGATAATVGGHAGVFAAEPTDQQIYAPGARYYLAGVGEFLIGSAAAAGPDPAPAAPSPAPSPTPAYSSEWKRYRARRSAALLHARHRVRDQHDAGDRWPRKQPLAQRIQDALNLGLVMMVLFLFSIWLGVELVTAIVGR